MSACLQPKDPRSLLRHAACWVLFVTLIGCDSRPSTVPAPEVFSQGAVCEREAQTLVAEAEALLSVGDFAEAQRKIAHCRIALMGKSTVFDAIFNRAAIAEVQDALKHLPQSEWEQRLSRLRELKAAGATLAPNQSKELISLEARDAAASKQRDAAQIAVQAMKYYPFCNELGRAVRAPKRGVRDEVLVSHAESTYRVSRTDMVAIRSKRIEVGMSMCAVVAVLGTPSEVREFQSVGSKGWSVWYRERGALLYLDKDQNVTRFSL